MRTYKFEIIITEGNDEFWEQLKGTGCNEILKSIENCLDEDGWIMAG